MSEAWSPLLSSVSETSMALCRLLSTTVCARLAKAHDACTSGRDLPECSRTDSARTEPEVASGCES